MVKFVPLMTAFIVTGLFAFSLITGGMMFQLENDAPIYIGDDPALASLNNSLASTIRDTHTDVTQSSQAFSNSSISSQGGTPYMDAIGGVWKVIKTGPVTLYNLISVFVFGKIFGQELGYIVTDVFALLLALVTISAVVMWVVRGEGG